MTDTADTRNPLFVCKCGGIAKREQGLDPNKVRCQECKLVWYADHCWNCATPIDGRETERCPNPKCRWHFCPACHACSVKCKDLKIRKEAVRAR